MMKSIVRNNVTKVPVLNDGSENPTYVRSSVPFSALTVWYLPGLDHEAHLKGMGEYKAYFQNVIDDYVKKMVDKLKALGEFDNKIFIVIADHGHTAMPTNLTYERSQPVLDMAGNVATDLLGNPVISVDHPPAAMSCELNLDFSTTDDREAERNNNNLHIWELANLFTQFPSPVPETTLKILAPKEIANLTSITGATSDIASANIIAALNGPMAHIYIRGTSWQSDPDPQILNLVINRLYFYLKTGLTATGSDKQKLNQYFPRLMNSIGDILVRKRTQTPTGIEDIYEVVTSISEDASGNLNIATAAFSDAIGDVNAVNRIKKLNNFNRSGDIVLLMNDKTDGSATDRYTTGVACKSWHGSLNRSDSYVPFILSYPGGNKDEMIKVTSTICINNGCEGNWSVTELIKNIIQRQY